MTRGGQILCRAALLLWAGAATAQTITQAEYTDPTTRYAHGVLGDAVEWGALRLTLSDGRHLVMTLPDTLVFEDTSPRLADLDGDGRPEVVVVESSLTAGARLAVYGPAGRIAATPHIGTRNRWLAPVGVADLDGDGRVELAYVDRPHLANRLRVWRYDAGTLTHLADADGLTNHKIGWDFIPGGIRDCGTGPQMITADAGWQQVMATQFDGTRLISQPIAPYTAPRDLDAALSCP
ncbi:FG-GAP repeat domain-containing protein [Lacimonas salitolerans]|uniref:FG-GAP repeat domain-containing protein n=1 Tax=Lacimonas salitolerans TaxID=1323750 RepID=A0ABW4EFR3_9RHOB